MFQQPKNMRVNGTSEQQLIEIEIEHLLDDVEHDSQEKSAQNSEV